MMENRETKLQEDIDSLVTLAGDCVYLQILETSADTLQLKLFNPFDENGCLDLIFNFSVSDYPEGTVVSQLGSEVSSIQAEVKPLLDLVAVTCYAWCKKHKLEVPRFAEIVQDKLKEEKEAMEVQHLDSQASVTSGEYPEASDTDDVDYGYEDMSDDESYVHPLLDKEVRQVQKKFGSNSIETRIHAGIDEMDLFFNIDMNDFLDGYTASAWRVNLEVPLVVLLHIRSVSKYLDGVEPQVEVFQEQSKSSGEKVKAGMGIQLKKIMESFVNSQWKKLTNSELEGVFRVLDGDEEALSVGGTEVIRKKVVLEPVPAFDRQGSLGAQMSMFSGFGASQADKSIPPIKNGFLVQFLQYALHRIQSLNEFCVICDERHVLDTGLLKPCVCTRELCVFAFQTLGVMADAAEAIATDADVVDLLIAMANAAGHSSRSNLILDPYPSVVDPDDSSKLALDPKEKDFNLVRKILKDVVQCREQVLRGRVSNLHKTLKGYHRLAFPLMQWIIATCRAHIVLLPQARLLKSMKTKYQFLLISSPPKKEVAFKNAKEQHGSKFAFHGSNIENWHSIMRKGLINATGTQFQLHGAAHGSGVYLSPKSNVSFGYTTSLPAAKKNKPLETDCLAGKLNLRCLALCEVVTTRELKANGDIWVCSNPDNVCTRFFFVYDTSTSVSTNTTSPEFKQEIDHAMAYMKAVKAIT